MNSWDEMPNYTFHNDESYKWAVQFFECVYGPILSDSIVRDSEILMSWVDWTKAPGFDWSPTYKRKKDIPPTILWNEFVHYRGTAIYNVAGKVEYCSKEDRESHKIRLFQIPPVELLLGQLKFGKQISLKIMGYHWSAYGFNPFMGGFPTLARSLLTKPRRGCYDVSGWDKFIPLMHTLYSSLSKFMKFSSTQEEDHWKWVMKNTVAYFFKSDDGRVFLKRYGNASGTGVTTRDNIFMHVILFSSALFAAYLQKNGSCPDWALVASQTVYLFGDDNIFSVDHEFSLVCDIDFMTNHYSKFGLKIKFLYTSNTEDLSPLSFLGANIIRKNGSYLPQYDIVRLATSVLYDAEPLDLEQYVGKVHVLFVMSYPSEHHGIFREAYTQLLNSHLVLESDNLGVISYRSEGVPTEYELHSFYTGLESTSVTVNLEQVAEILGL